MIVEQFKALGDPVRWSIIDTLRHGTQCACRLGEVTAVSAPLLSHHLKVLRDAGLITGKRRGRWIDYTLDHVALDRLGATLDVRAEATR